MNNFSEAMFAILIVTVAITGIVLAFTVGTLLAPIVVVVFAILFVYQIQKEMNAPKKRKRKRRK